MNTSRTPPESQVIVGEWITFPGGELEGKRPRALCPACRATLHQRAAAATGSEARGLRRTVCFQCYRAELERERALRAAGQINTASEARFQVGLPFEPVNRARLERLRAERDRVQAADRRGAGQYIQRERQAQIAARHALQRVAAGLDEAQGTARVEQGRLVASAIHAAELQLPDSWLSFVVSR